METVIRKHVLLSRWHLLMTMEVGLSKVRLCDIRVEKKLFVILFCSVKFWWQTSEIPLWQLQAMAAARIYRNILKGSFAAFAEMLHCALDCHYCCDSKPERMIPGICRDVILISLSGTQPIIGSLIKCRHYAMECEYKSFFSLSCRER